MSFLTLVIAFVSLVQAPVSPDSSHTTITDLVARFMSNDTRTRDAATSSLKRLGPEALPALRAARAGTSPVLESCIAELIRKIERDQLINPIKLVLDYKDVTMRTVIGDLTMRTGCRVSIDPNSMDWLNTRITLQSHVPIPFWTAIDKVCEAGRFGSNLGVDGNGSTVAIFRDFSTGPVSDHGPFRVQLDEIWFQGRYKELHLSQVGNAVPEQRPGNAGVEKSFINIHVNAEPRMFMKDAGKLKSLTAVDDLGQSLIPSDYLDKQNDFEIGFTSDPITLGRIPLARAKNGSRQIKLLRGVAPVAVGGLRAEPIRIQLLDGEGKNFQGDDTVITVDSVTKRASTRSIVIENMGQNKKLEKAMPQSDEILSVSLSIRPLDLKAPPPELSWEQFSIRDETGKLWKSTPWYLTGNKPQAHGNSVKCVLSFTNEDLTPMPWPHNLKGVTLRYFEMIVVPVDVPFEFKDVDLP